MAEAKTKPTTQSVNAFLDHIADEGQRQDSARLVKLMRAAARAEPKLWGTSIVGFGSYHYKYASGREGEAPLTGFSPRKAALTLYIKSGFDQYEDLLGRLGKYRQDKGCLYIKRLSDVDLTTLKELVRLSVQHMRKAWPEG